MMNPEIPNHPIIDVPKQEIFREFRERVGEVDVLELENFQPSISSILHVARHLRSIATETQKELLGQARPTTEGDAIIDESYIQALLATAGSKFHESISDPRRVIEFCRQQMINEIHLGKPIAWYEDSVTKEQTARLCQVVSPTEKQKLGLTADEYLGDCGVIEITSALAQFVKEVRRGEGEATDQIIVNTLPGFEAPNTDSLVMMLHRPSDQHPLEFSTAYTGIDTPNFPRITEQSTEEFERNKEWWNRHAFVVPSTGH